MNDTSTNKASVTRDLLPKILIVAIVMIAGGFLLLTNSHTSPSTGTAGATKEPLSLEPPPPTCGYCDRNLIGKTSDEIGQFTVDMAKLQLNVQGPLDVALVQSIKWDDTAALGLGCLPDFASIEDAPLALVILKGDIDISSIGAGFSSLPSAKRQTTSVAFVMDLWSAGWVYVGTDGTGSDFSDITQKSTSQAVSSGAQATCPPRAPRTLHYGQSAGGEIVPTLVPEPTATAGPTVEPPLPIPTQERP
jgi:hypothetical protein